ncbi:Nif3-like dinuclear metal center hexameric protein [Spirosoma fluviale]|uniref:GTP cyclohydrolase 1 type 2, NIF3 family n=1 Tax=Spirosoma fluviale TaxID=1597977 RepID=A0A286GHR8_9BACT|nr:Nif3-like dinuclear metal center hexameric protein [Spirosoma fluviale]SOD94756.1 Putative GTP cyclohydrolase 1 type 2, NIF3 family [Spirosoma fluviale]
MDSATRTINDIANLLKKELSVHHYPAEEQGGVYHPSAQPVQRIGLALEPFPGLAKWVTDMDLDALWLHRPWQLDLTHLPADVGVLSHHLPFDETLTVGYNTHLASQLGALNPPEPLGYKSDTATKEPLPKRPIGMLVDVPEQEFDYWLTVVKDHFGGYDRAEAGHGSTGWHADSSRIAVVGAMTDALVREAADRGAHLYLTGAYRKPGQQAVDETGIAVIAVGHRRCEEWGLDALATLLRDQCSVDCVVHHQPLVIRG